jgi:hypothetical protein
MPSDLETQLENALGLEKELAFLPPGEERRKEKERKRNAWLRAMVEGRPLPGNGKLSLEEAKLLGMAVLFLREAQEEDGRILPPQPQAVLCRGVRQHELEVLDAYRRRALRLWREVLDIVEEDRSFKHQERKFCLERTIKKLRTLDGGAGQDETFQKDARFELSRALFLRAKIIRRKGFTVPLKKKERLTEALDILPAGDEAVRLRAWLHYELARLEDDGGGFESMIDEGWKALQDAAGQIDLAANPSDAVLLLTAAEKEPVEWKSSLEKLMLEDNPLDQAWAAWLLDKKAKAVALAREAAARMPAAFSHEGWERLVRLIRLMETCHPEASGWQEVALEAWEFCRKRESRTSRHHLRWYWSRQRELYDFAFRAASSTEQRARIADSLKSRPAFTLSQLQERIATDKELEKLSEEEAKGYLDQYIPNISGNLQQKPVEEISWQNLPAPWITVHFYLEDRKGEKNGDQTGHAIIYNSSKKEWVEKPFCQVPLWQAFWAWQEAYRLHGEKADSNEKELLKCAAPLENLCLTLGGAMGFLFEPNLFPPDQPVLFVTHDFLHRLPIHMAMRDDEKGDRFVWAETHSSTYLPAFWVWQKRCQKEDKEFTPAASPPIAMITLSPTDATRSQATVGVITAVKDKGGKIYDPATADALFKIENPPKFLAIISHGEAHPINPFASCLLDGDKPWVTVQGILFGRMNITGSKVALAACEADLVPPLSSTVDEHLSVSTAFLQKDVAELFGTLWRVVAGQAGALTAKMVASGGPMLDALAGWQQQQVEFYRKVARSRAERLRTLYRCAPFRVLGVSEFLIKEKDNAEG